MPSLSERSQPIHTVYGGAHLFTAGTFRKLADIARQSLREYAPDARTLSDVFGLENALADRIHPRLVEKLDREPIEDYRIDFEDGFGWRPDDEEDRAAVAAGRELAAADDAPRALGIRIKPLSEESKRRSLRTFDLFLGSLIDADGRRLLERLVITLPKITTPSQVAVLAEACDAFEERHGLPENVLRIELMVETPETIVDRDGGIALPRMVAAGRARVIAAHFGPYDYTAACHITAAHQDLRHPACDFARRVMQVGLASSGVWIADGPTILMPIAPHRPPTGGVLTREQQVENHRVVHQAWRLHAENVRKALVDGFYQGWDLHPAQIPARYAAVYAFFLEALGPASARLRNFMEHAAQATRVGNLFDDAATGQGLLNFFLRAVRAGAIGEEEAVRESGLTLAEIRSRSFAAILGGGRRQG
jgi:citrate lyase beta subunit